MTQENWTYTYYVRDAQGNVMATYKRSLTADIDQQLATDKLLLEENQLYGSARLGVDDRESENISSVNTFAWNGGYTADGELDPAAPATQAKMAAVNVLTPKRKLGLKLYELSNHLGNVLVTVSDRKLGKQLGATSAVEYYMADVRSTSDYSAFGAPLSGRTNNAPGYRYSMNGQEKDEEPGAGVTTAEYWEYDEKLARRWNMDPVVKFWESGYTVFSNTPSIMVDPKGNTDYYNSKGKWIGTDGIDNGQKMMALKKSTAKTIKNATKNNQVISLNEDCYPDLVYIPDNETCDLMLRMDEATQQKGIEYGAAVGIDSQSGNHEEITTMAQPGEKLEVQTGLAVEKAEQLGLDVQYTIHTHPSMSKRKDGKILEHTTSDPSHGDIVFAQNYHNIYGLEKYSIVIGPEYFWERQVEHNVVNGEERERDYYVLREGNQRMITFYDQNNVSAKDINVLLPEENTPMIPRATTKFRSFIKASKRTYEDYSKHRSK